MNLHRVDTGNLGDRVSSPTLYFDFLKAVRRYDLLRVSRRVASGARLILFGGGGLLDNDYFRKGWDDVLAGSTAEMIGWGLGHNRHGSTSARYPGFLDRFSLLGVRDCDPGLAAPFEWVPCASCLHEEFGTPHDITTDVVCYEHGRHALGVDGFPTMRNTERDFVSVIRFLASAETVLTKHLPRDVLGDDAGPEGDRLPAFQQVPRLQVSRDAVDARRLEVGARHFRRVPRGVGRMPRGQSPVCREGARAIQRGPMCAGAAFMTGTRGLSHSATKPAALVTCATASRPRTRATRNQRRRDPSGSTGISSSPR